MQDYKVQTLVNISTNDEVLKTESFWKFNYLIQFFFLILGFKERWFKLRANILFYFNLNESGKIYDNKKVIVYFKLKFGI